MSKTGSYRRHTPPMGGRISKMFATLTKTFRIEIEPAEAAVFEDMPA